MKNLIPTPHIGAKERIEIAPTVLMPGDPLRAKYIAEKFLENPKSFNKVRGMFGFTGEYKGQKVSVMGSGMGMPSIGIYAYELYNFYGVQNIIRVGSCGAYSKDLNLRDIIIPSLAYTDSNYGKVLCESSSKYVYPQLKLRPKLIGAAHKLNIRVGGGTIHSSDIFYHSDPKYYKRIHSQEKCVAVEMESYALFLIAKNANKGAASILTVSDRLFDLENSLSSKEREQSFDDMVKIALESI